MSESRIRETKSGERKFSRNLWEKGCSRQKRLLASF